MLIRCEVGQNAVSQERTHKRVVVPNLIDDLLLSARCFFAPKVALKMIYFVSYGQRHCLLRF